MIQIKTERLTLRTFEQKDSEGLYSLLSNPRVNCFRCECISTIEEANKELEEKIKADDGTEIAVCLSDNDKFIGTVFSMKEDPDTYSVCWNFLAVYSGKGYAFESAKAYIDFLFNEKDARRIYAYVEDDNISSQNLCKRLGMRQEGLFLDFISFVNNPDGTPKYENTMQFAILKKEWLAD